MLVLVLTAAAGASAVVAWMLDRRRCRRRNKQGERGACGVSWAETRSGDPYLIHGRLVCEDCAAKAKRRMPWHFGILAAAAAVAAVAAGVIVAGEGVVADVLAPVGSTVLMILVAVQSMKLATRSWLGYRLTAQS
jgi:hypothetical protein